jgi:hypothetical protein
VCYASLYVITVSVFRRTPTHPRLYRTQAVRRNTKAPSPNTRFSPYIQYIMVVCTSAYYYTRFARTRALSFTAALQQNKSVNRARTHIYIYNIYTLHFIHMSCIPIPDFGWISFFSLSRRSRGTARARASFPALSRFLFIYFFFHFPLFFSLFFYTP